MSAEVDKPKEPRGAGRGALISWALFDWANSSFNTVIQTFVFAAFFTRHVAEDSTTGTAQWGTALGITGAVVAVCGPVLGAVSDQGGRRKPWLGAFTALCVLTTALLWFITPQSDIWLALLLVAVATFGYECANIFYNAMLPNLSPANQVGRWSGWGFALGYAGGLICLTVALFAFVRADNPLFGLDRENYEHVRATFPLVAVWFALFALPLFIIAPDTRGSGKSIGRSVRDGVRQLIDSARQVSRYANIVRFLIARMLYIDGLATIFVMGGVYAAGTFDMTEEQVLKFGIALNVTAGLGALSFAWIDDWLGSKRTIAAALVGLLLSGTAILLAPSQAWFWIFGLVLGIFVGPVQAASRSLLSRLAPPDLRTQMFGLYALSGKATAFAGPMLVGWVTVWTASQRVGMATLLVLILAGLLLLLTVRSPGHDANGN